MSARPANTQAMALFFAACLVLGLPIVIMTGQPILFGLISAAVAIVMWGVSRFKGWQNG